jgi:hypothetical protein
MVQSICLKWVAKILFIQQINQEPEKSITDKRKNKHIANNFLLIVTAKLV